MELHHIDGGSLIDVAIEPKLAADQARLLAVLQALVADDASLRYSHDVESGLTTFGGQSEHHLDEAVDKIMQIHRVALNIGAPQVAYRERLTRAVEVSYTHMKIVGAAGEFAKVSILFEPSSPNSGFAFESLVSNDTLLKAHVSGVRQGLEAARQSGVLAGFPVVDFKATLTEGAYHELDSNERTFEIAARQAFRMIEKQALELLEPVFAAAVTTPDEFLGGVIGDLNLRRGQVLTVENKGQASSINALVPVSNMFGYRNNLRALTRGVGTVSLRFDHYAVVPRSTNDDDPRFPPAAAMRMRA